MILFYGLFIVLLNLVVMMTKVALTILVSMFVVHKLKFGKHATVKTFIKRNMYRINSLFV